MSFDHRTSERVKAVIRSLRVTNDNDTIDYVASLIVDQLQLHDAPFKTSSQLFDCIGHDLISYDAAADESSSRAVCTRLLAGLKEKKVIRSVNDKKGDDDKEKEKDKEDKDKENDNDDNGDGDDNDTDPEDDAAIDQLIQDMANIELKVGMTVQALLLRDRQWYDATISAIEKIKGVATSDNTATATAATATVTSARRSPSLASTKGVASVPSISDDNDHHDDTTGELATSSSSAASSSSSTSERPKSSSSSRSGRSPSSSSSSRGGRQTTAAKKREAAAKKRERTASKRVEWVNVYRIAFDGFPDHTMQVPRHHIRVPISDDSSSASASSSASSTVGTSKLSKLLVSPLAHENKESSSSSSSNSGNGNDVPLSPRSRARILEEQARERDIARGRADPECAMCERVMPLTAHHLTPRTTHAKYLAAGVTQAFLNTCVDVCRPCHSALHKLIDEPTLAAEYNTLDKLMADERIQRWVNYARKQRARPKAHGHDAKTFKYRR